jgi:hypothetical protein
MKELIERLRLIDGVCNEAAITVSSVNVVEVTGVNTTGFVSTAEQGIELGGNNNAWMKGG